MPQHIGPASPPENATHQSAHRTHWWATTLPNNQRTGYMNGLKHSPPIRTHGGLQAYNTANQSANGTHWWAAEHTDKPAQMRLQCISNGVMPHLCWPIDILINWKMTFVIYWDICPCWDLCTLFVSASIFSDTMSISSDQFDYRNIISFNFHSDSFSYIDIYIHEIFLHPVLHA